MSIVMHGMNRKGEKRCGFWRAAAAMCLLCGIGTSCAAAPVLTEGPLLKFRESGKTAFLGLVDPQEHVRAVAAVGDQAPGLPNARQEFCGHYLDLCATYWHIDREPRAKAFGDLVVAAAGESMSEDGYIGGETPERRKLGFSLWNQAHVVYGLLGFAKATGSGAALRLGVKAADWLFRTQSAMTPAELVNPKTSWNDGSQHLTAFYSFALAADATGDERYLDYVGNTLKGLESTKMNFLSSDGCLDMQSRKGIEMLNAWRGVLAYAQRRDDPEARTAALRNWRSIADTQIREPGSSTCAERFYEGGGRPELLPITRKPNENCVQCGWLRFSREMFGATGEPQCMDEMERTLYNHILGSVSNAGDDFAYYQGNIGRKSFRKNGSYQCCRYRGFAIMAHLPELLLDDDGHDVTPLVYAPVDYTADDGFHLSVKTGYPADGRICLTASGARPRRLRLRIPGWCDGYELAVNGEKTSVRESGGFLAVPIGAGKTTVELVLTMKFRRKSCTIDGRSYAVHSYGPLVLVRDTHFGDRIGAEMPDGLAFARQTCEPDCVMVRFDAVDAACNRHVLVDYASACRHLPDTDEFEVFVPLAADGTPPVRGDAGPFGKEVGQPAG